ncbi:MlaD family protein [Mycobacterium sp. CVI_P3]|uniref:MlaD family protein n=1 Tax=Mycobacterium pinniadriaticum TaxID=2994102 RepID=A0ABT3SJS0_9MYCO|nr:MlaD family protein [Mycobacterium pinniadriaticum]MCX2932925.1 MlaD family protein [Mycobacterium pinniadriaticum]MCX2939403.1 MlaD family protein [Mycobacterium pinniadriaticum]
MLTRFIRTQLIIFTIASVIGISVMVVTYLQVGTLLGIGRMTVTLELPRTGGLYQFSNVTYRGVQLGKVTEVRPTRTGAVATLSLATNPKVPADLEARVQSVSAVGEQYVDLVPHTDSGPYLQDGSVIPVNKATVPQAIGPMLDQVNTLLKSIPKDRVGALLDNAYKGLNGTGDDLATLTDSASRLAADFSGTADQARTLLDDSRPLLDGQLASVDAIRTWAHSLAGITDQLNTNDPQWRGILANGPGAADEASALLNQVKPTLPVLLASLTTVGQVAVTYHAGIEQLLVLLPPYIGSVQAVGSPLNNPTGMTLGDFTLTMNDPPACTVGFLPPSQWRSPEDLSDIDTPNGLYCKLPQDSPIAVRGARNYPCQDHPGKRAPTVEICDSDKPYEPLAMRQHATGPNPIDPNLIAQGIPPDDRVTFQDHIYGPLQGTPTPAGPVPAAPAAPIPPPGGFTGPVGAPDIAPTDQGGAPAVAPSAFTPGQADGPSVAIATYDPATGQYATPDGNVFRQTDLVHSGDQTWKNLLPTT